MKKILLILCALVCGTLAFAQSGTYTDNLHVIVNGDDEGVKKGNVTIEYQEGETSIIDFTLHNFSVDISMSGTPMSINLGDVTVYDIELGEEVDGVAEFSCTDDHHVEYPDIDSEYASWVTDVAITMTGDLSETKLHANMAITVKILGILSYPITATFGYDFECLIVNTETGNYLGGGLAWGTQAAEIGKPQFFTFTDQFDGTYKVFGNQGGTSIGWASPDDGYFYVDAATPLTWELIEDENSTGYYLAYDNGYLLSGGFQEPMSHTNTYANATVWKLVTMDDVVATMDDASASNPVDVTPLIPAPEPKHANWGNSWVATDYNNTTAPNNHSFGQDWNPASVCESIYSENGFDIRQTFSLPKTGYYVVSAHAFYRNDGGDVIPSMYVTTGTCATDEEGDITKVDLPLHTTSAANMVDAYNEFLDGLYPVSLLFKVDTEDEDFTVGFESNVEDNDQMWTIFGELGLSYTGSEAPILEAVEGTMNKTVEETMTAALQAYNTNPTSATYAAAAQAIAAAEESIAQYEQMAADIAAVVPDLDDAGTEAWEASDACTGYEAQTLESADEVIAALSAAQKAQTTANSDLTYALLNSGTWAADQGNGPNDYNGFATETYITSGEATDGKVLYYTVKGLQPGTYTVTFYAAANMANDVSGDSGDNLADAYANGETSKLTIGTNSAAQITSLDDMTLVTITCTVAYDGILEFGLEDTSDGGNWFLCAAGTLTLLEYNADADQYVCNITDLLANPSFELDDVTDLTEDETRSYLGDEYTGGAYTVESLTGWTLVAPTNTDSTRPVADIMTEDCKHTDDDFGAPGTPSDGTQMLYLRNAWIENAASALQTIVLPAGEYKVTVDSKCVTKGSSTAALVVGEESKALTINSTMPEDWDTAVLEFSLTETTEVSLGVKVTFANSNGLSVLLDNFQLWSTEEVDDYVYDLTEAISNPSFELDDVSDWTPDTNESGSSRCDSEGKGAWVIPETGLTGWNINGTVSVKDIMSADAVATDNDFGAPGEPADGTYMLYLRDSWNEEESTVLQSLKLPAGDYKATVNTKCVSTASSTATLVVGDEEPVALTIHSTMPSAWDTAVLTFSLKETTEVSFGVDIKFNGANGSFLLDNFKLWCTEDVELPELDYDYDVTWALANPSFEVDNVLTNLPADEDRNAYDVMDAGVTGWTLPTLSVHTENAAFSVIDLMTKDAADTDNNFGVPGDPSDGSQMLYIRDAWQEDEDVKLTQELTLPAGDYKITVDTKCVSTSTSKATLFAGDKSKALTIHGTSNGSADTKTNPFLDAWDTATLTFSLDAETTVSLGVEVDFDGANGSFLLDNFKLYSVDEIEKEISWTMTEAGWGTLILPFDASVPDGLTLYAGDVITVGDSELEVGDAASTIAANTPYLVSGTADTYTFTGTPTNTADTYTVGVLTGTLVDLAVAKGAAFTLDGTEYLLQNQEEVDGLAFYAILAATEDADNSAEATLDAYHCYLNLTGEDAAPASLGLPGMATAIEAVESDLIANDAIYDLSGRRVAKAVKGVYIQNGKKVLVK